MLVLPEYDQATLVIALGRLRSSRSTELDIVPIEKKCVSCSVMSDSLQPRGPESTGPLHPWDSAGKNAGVGCHFLLQGIFPARDCTRLSHVAGRLFTNWAAREARRRKEEKEWRFLGCAVALPLPLLQARRVLLGLSPLLRLPLLD